MHAVIEIARFTWLEALRHRYLWLACAVVVLAFLIAMFAAGLALTDSAGYRSGIYAGGVRLALVAVVMLAVASVVAREQDERRYELTLSRPVSRAGWFVGRLLGFIAVAGALAGLASIPAAGLAGPLAGATWGLSLFAELSLVAAACMSAVVTLRQVSATVLAVGAFYVLARAMPAIALMSRGPAVDPAAWSTRVIAALVDALALGLPRLDRYSQSAWLGTDGVAHAPLLSIALESAVYITLLVAIGLIDLHRRNDR